MSARWASRLLAVCAVALVGCGDDDDDRNDGRDSTGDASGDTRDGTSGTDVAGDDADAATRPDGGNDADSAGNDADAATDASTQADSDGGVNDVDGTSVGDADTMSETDGSTPEQSFSAFVIELIDRPNADSAQPVPYADFATLADDDSANVFDGLFD